MDGLVSIRKPQLWGRGKNREMIGENDCQSFSLISPIVFSDEAISYAHASYSSSRAKRSNLKGEWFTIGVSDSRVVFHRNTQHQRAVK